ncbi:MAG: hypothetical protein ACK4L7_03755, partial [Flavobacteriales bacterium]
MRPPFRAIHVAALALCAALLPWSTALLSMAQMLLAANWIAAGAAQGDGRLRWRRAFIAPEPLVFISFLGIHAIGLAWTDDLGWGLSLCRILLPVLVFGAVLAGSDRLSERELRLVLLLGAWSVVASGLAGLLLAGEQGDYRGLSRFISHIRLALLLAMAIAILFWYWPRAAWQRLAHAAGAGLAGYLIMRLGSIQGAAIVGLFASYAVWHSARAWRPAVRWALRAALLVLAPRKPERFEMAARIARESGWRIARRSELDLAAPLAPDTEILLLDTVGELAAL